MRSTRRQVPSFSLYGEQALGAAPTDGVHIEDIQSRSRKYLWKIDTHRHTHLSQCVFVSSGPVTVTLDEARAEMVGPAVMIIPATTVHSFRFRPDTQGFVLTLDLDRMRNVTSDAHRAAFEDLFCAPRVADLGTDSRLAIRIEPLLQRMHQEFREPESAVAPVGMWLACSVLWILALHLAAETGRGQRSGQDADRLRAFRLLIEVNLLKHWSIGRYARNLSLSETSLNRVCRRLAGATAFDLIQQRMALEARRRLIYVPGSVSGIAAELGFKDAAYFSRFFRRRNGISPHEFRRRHGGG